MLQREYIKIEKLTPPEFDGRLEVDHEFDIELSKSIKELGVMEPIIVRRKGKIFEIIFGSCRYRASKIAGLDSMPCIIVKADDELAEKMKLHENLKRLPPSHIDQAYTFARLRTEFKLTESEISKLSGKSVPYISQHINLLDAGEELIKSVQKEEINFSVARELMHVKNENTRKHLLNYAIKGGASVDVVKNWVQESRQEEEFPDLETPHADSEPPSFSRPPSSFVCKTCEKPTQIVNMYILRICPECHNSIMTDIMVARKAVTTENTP